MKDPEFIEAAQKATLWLEPLTATQIDALIKKAYASPPETIERARSLLERALSK